MQMRGTFRLARRILALAAILTLLGGIGYALTLPGSNDPKASAGTAYVAGLAATATVNPGTPSAEALEQAGKGHCVDHELHGVWIGNEKPPSTTGPFTIVVTEPAECRGQTSVDKGGGSIELST
jgi:hypothetical protein